jgi:hypothetical protein
MSSKANKRMRGTEKLEALNMLRVNMVRRHERPEIIHAVSKVYLRELRQMEAATGRK